MEETDFSRIAIGYPVEIVFDALPENIFFGEIIQINPNLKTVSGVNAIAALVLLDADPFAKTQSLLIGMNVQAEVIAGRVPNAILIPVQALVEVGPGDYVVYLVEDGQLQRREITVGLIDFTSAEVLEGLSVGEVVVLGYEEDIGN